jgi:hypothetical protein
MKALDNAALAMFCIAVISTAGAIVCRIAHCLGKNKPKSVSAE